MKDGIFMKTGTIVLVAVCLMAYFTSSMIYESMDDYVLSRKEVIVSLSATIVKDRVEHIAEHGESLASQKLVKDFVAKKEWSNAINNLREIPKIFPEIDQLFIVDTDGILKAITGTDQSIEGQSFSFKDWYKGVTKDSKKWITYVSDVYQATNEPKNNIILVAIPIKADDGTPIGILGLQIKTDVFSDWLKDIKLDNGEFVYAVDKKGDIIFHPRYNPQGSIIDYSSVPEVINVTKGESGVGVLYNRIEQEERVSSYRQISEYGWGVIATQQSSSALLVGRKHFALFVLLWIALIVLILYFLKKTNKYSAQLNSRLELERVFLQSIGDGVMAIDRDWNITVWNKMSEVLTGWKKDEVMGKSLRNFVRFIREKDRKENVVFIEETMMDGTASDMENNTLLIRRDGNELPVADSSAPLFDHSGKVNGAVIIFRDQTKQVDIEKAKREVFYNIIHDLRGPSSGIKAFLDVYSDSDIVKNDPEFLENFGLVRDANNRMIDLINGLLNESRQSKPLESKEFIHLSKIIDPIIKELAEKARNHDVSIQYLSSTEWPPMFINRMQATEIFTNLVDNAIKYNKEGGKVMIEHALNDGSILTKIKDTGRGISKENLGKLFIPYFRADETSKIQGTGLGISIVKKFVEDSGGKITVDSEVGKGTTFTVSIPIKS